MLEWMALKCLSIIPWRKYWARFHLEFLLVPKCGHSNAAGIRQCAHIDFLQTRHVLMEPEFALLKVLIAHFHRNLMSWHVVREEEPKLMPPKSGGSLHN